ncbi:MAG: hypothetical protein JNN22_12000 [Rhodospirillales bacterium]|nr:hypothetical protein [Rhodospirillales bacterium]
MNDQSDLRRLRRDAWVDDALAGVPDRIGAAFAEEGGAMPTMIWGPRPEDARTRQIAFLARMFSGGERGCLVDPVLLRPALGYINLLEPVDGGQNFRFRLYGSCLAEVTDEDLTGRLLTDLRASAHVIDFAVACYRATAIRDVPLMTVRHPAGAKHVIYWERIVVPYRCMRSGEARLLVGNVPVEVAGSRTSQFVTLPGT